MISGIQSARKQISDMKPGEERMTTIARIARSLITQVPCALNDFVAKMLAAITDTNRSAR